MTREYSWLDVADMERDRRKNEGEPMTHFPTITSTHIHPTQPLRIVADESKGSVWLTIVADTVTTTYFLSPQAMHDLADLIHKAASMLDEKLAAKADYNPERPF